MPAESFRHSHLLLFFPPKTPLQDLAALAALEEQALASRGGGGRGASGGATATGKPNNNSNSADGKTVVDGLVLANAAPFLSSSRPAHAFVDLTADSPRENHDPSVSRVDNEGIKRPEAGETVAMNVEEEGKAEATKAKAAPAALPAPLPPPPRLTLVDVSKPQNLVALPWLHAEINLDR